MQLTSLPAADPTTEQTLAADTAAVYSALTDLVRVYQFRDRDRICCHDLSVSAYYALDAVITHGPVSLGALADLLYLDKSSTSRLVSGLERRGYVVRAVSPEDARGVRLTVTPAGVSLHGCIVNAVMAEQQELLAGFTPEVRRAMATLLRSLATATASRAAGDLLAGCCRLFDQVTAGQPAGGQMEAK